MSTSFEPFALHRGEGTPLQTPTGDTVYVKTTTAGTRGSMSVLELVVAAKSGPALHSHVREDEVWYVLEGEFRFKAGDAMFWVAEGGMAFGPRCLPHSFQNVGEATGRLLILTAPSGAERFFEDYDRHLPGPVEEDVLSAVARANWIQFVGPPLAVSDPLDG